MKRVLVTGGTGGIGKATLEAFCARGDKVYFTYLSRQKEAEEIARATGAQAFCCDLRQQKEIDALTKALPAIDILVNNAGISLIKQIQDVSLSEFKDVFALNVEAAFLLIKNLVPAMISRRFGRIVSISSMWGQTGASCESVYSASKAALIGLTKSLAKELAPSGVTVNAVSPGVIDTPMNDFDESVMNALKEETPIGRIGLPSDVARCVLFLAEDESSFITGQVLCPNGGFLI